MTEPESLAPYTKFIWISSRESRGSERRWPPGFGVRDEWVYGCLFGQRRRHVWSDDATAIGILSWGVSRACPRRIFSGGSRQNFIALVFSSHYLTILRDDFCSMTCS